MQAVWNKVKINNQTIKQNLLVFHSNNNNCGNIE